MAEKNKFFSYKSQKQIRYERIELIKPENYQQLLEDLQQRTGIDIKSYEINQVDFLRDTAELIIYYDKPA